MAQENQILRISGDVYLFPIVSDVEQPGIGPLPAKFSYNSTKMTEVSDIRKNKRGQVIAVVPEMQVLSGELEVTTIPKLILAMYSQSELNTLTQSANAVQSAYTQYTCASDKWTKLPLTELYSVILRDHATTPTITYAEGVDYELNNTMGMFRPIVGSTLAAETSVFVSYKVRSIAGSKIVISSQCDTLVRILIDGINEACGTSESIICRVPKARLTAKDAFTFDDEKPKTLKFDVKADNPVYIEFPVLA